MLELQDHRLSKGSLSTKQETARAVLMKEPHAVAPAAQETVWSAGPGKASAPSSFGSVGKEFITVPSPTISECIHTEAQGIVQKNYVEGTRWR